MREDRMDPISRHREQPAKSFDGGTLDCGNGLLLLIRKHIMSITSMSFKLKMIAITCSPSCMKKASAQGFITLFLATYNLHWLT